MTGESVTTLHDYQLAMLHVMCTTAPAQAADLLDRIGATRADAETAERRWWFEDSVNNFGSLAEYVTAWGAPDSQHPHPDGAHVAQHGRWDLSFWPGLQIELMEVHRQPGQVFRRLLRKPGTPQPCPDSVTDLTPWSCTQDEFENCGLGPFRLFDGFGDHRVIYDFEAIDPESGRNRTYSARLEWGLLQSVQ
ncbi:hypothetical protein [Nocardia tengchongensis]|uniref:hypothetical protein n=1 Tax=Nocardia tengchongensis TaxID=2055889 RepID=UPI0036BA9EE0